MSEIVGCFLVKGEQHPNLCIRLENQQANHIISGRSKNKELIKEQKKETHKVIQSAAKAIAM